MGGKTITIKKPGTSADKLVEEMVENENVTVNANVNVKQKKRQEESGISELFRAKEEREIKSRQVNLRVKETVWTDFDYIRKKLGYSQSDFFEVLVKLAKVELEKAEKE